LPLCLLSLSVKSGCKRIAEGRIGYRGRIISLVDVDSVKSRHYGELTFFTYKIEQNGGSPIAGDDATQVNFF
jgi:hypothetical protein